MNDSNHITDKSGVKKFHTSDFVNEYSEHKFLFEKDKKVILDLLAGALLARSIPDTDSVTATLSDDGYYIGGYHSCDDLDNAQFNLKHNFEKLEKAGWIKNGQLKEIEYKVNLHGCRSKNFSEIKDKDVIVGIGSSTTFGTGLYQEDTWIHKLADVLDCEYVNLSAPNCSTFIQSLLCTEYILEEFTNVKGVFLFTPPPGRLDLVKFKYVSDMNKDIKDRNIRITGIKSFIKEFLTSKRKFSNLEKNFALSAFYSSFFQSLHDILLLKYKCESKKIPFHEIDSALFDPPDNGMNFKGFARDLIHNGSRYHTDLFKTFLQMYNSDK